ncbi:MAG: molybdopterin molybdenumtransferase MoeA, partial [Thiothrix lacustris]
MTHTCDLLPQGILSVEQAQTRILSGIAALPANEPVTLWQAQGRILAETVCAPLDVPPYRNSAMDGYALRHADTASDQPLHVVGASFAGRPFAGQVQPGECVRIMTGAVVPAGTDSVVMQENVQREGDDIRLTHPLKCGDNVRHPGEDMRTGDTVLVPGRKLNAADIGLLASLGISEIKVLRRPRVAFCSTGDELRSVGEPLQVGDIYDSNRYTLYGLLQNLDVEIIDLGVVRDTPAAVEHAFQQAMQQADVFITSGGASVGEADYVTSTLERLGKVNFWKIAMKPGKPLAFGTLGE